MSTSSRPSQNGTVAIRGQRTPTWENMQTDQTQFFLNYTTHKQNVENALKNQTPRLSTENRLQLHQQNISRGHRPSFGHLPICTSMFS